MICFNCGNVLTNSDYCSHCGVDVSIYKKIVKLSNAYYNAGLMKARNRDLSGAVDALNRSIKLNKRQIDARNLLGLVYFEMGETVQAFREWVVSLNIQPDNNGADKYLLSIQSDKNKMNELNQSVRKFNVALAYAQNGTEDMAIVQLKKVLNQNPNLVKGHQLLAVLFMKNGEYERARKAVKKALKVDKCNALSYSYLREINKYLEDEKKNNPEQRTSRRRALRGVLVDRPYLSGDDVIIPQNHFKEAFSSAQTILHVVAGLLLGAALVYFIVFPARMSSEVDQVKEVKTEYDQKIAIKNSTITELQRQVDTLTSDIESANKELDKYKGKNSSISSNYTNILKALESYIDEDNEKSIDYLSKIDTKVKMESNTFTEVYNKLTDELSEQMADTYFNNGMTAYNNGEIKDSINNFTKCLEVDKNYVEAYYRLGWIYSQQGDTEKSQDMFKKIVDDFPNSEYYETAKAQVGEE